MLLAGHPEGQADQRRHAGDVVVHELADRFCVLGGADEHVAKLRELAAAGVDQFNVYLMNGDETEQIERIGREVIPARRLIS